MGYFTDCHKFVILMLLSCWVGQQQVKGAGHVLLFPTCINARQVLFESIESQLRIAGYEVTFLLFQEDLGGKPSPSQAILIPDGTWSGAQKELNNWQERALQNWDESIAQTPSTYLETLARRCEAILGQEQLLLQLRNLQLAFILGDLWGNDLCALALGKKLNVLVGGIVPTSLNEPLSHYLNIPYPPAYVPATGNENVGHIETLGDRALNLYLYLKRLYLWDRFFYKPASAQICKYFDRSIPPEDFYQDLAVIFVNGAVSLDFFPRPVPPNIVFIGGLHCHVPTLLPKDMDEIARAHRAGIILLTLSINDQHLPKFVITAFLEVLGQLSHATFWKTSLTSPKALPKNIFRNPAFPSQNVMGHGRTRLVISSCDRDTVIAAVFHQVPLLCIPVLEDQLELAKKVVTKGIGLTLTLKNLNQATLHETIQTLLSNNSFHLNAKHHSQLLRDEPEPPNDRLLFWMEYVIRHHGAGHLKIPVSKLKFWEYFYLDLFVIATLVTVAVILSVMCAIIVAKKLVTTKTSVKKKSD